MERLDLDEFEREARQFDELIGRTPDIDRFCSSTPWIFSAHEAFGEDHGHGTWIARSDNGFVALVESWHDRLGRFRQPMEASWCLASPFASARPRALVEEFAAACRREADQWDLLFLPGLKRDSAFYHALVEFFGGTYFVGVGPPVSRFIASLDGGVEGFLSRRTSKFRANLRRSRRRAAAAGVTREYLADFGGEVSWEQIYERILAVEARSWKGKSGTGIIDAPMQEFYRGMLPRLSARGALRVLFLRQGERDIAFVFGGLFQRAYRGLQLSYDEDYKKHSPGNLAQLAIIEELCEEGVESYDLGSEIDYKNNWAEERFETLSLVIRRW